MKKLVLTIMLLSAASLAGCKEEDEGEIREQSAYDRVLSTGEIKCGYGISPPALVQDANSGKLSGLDYDIWSEIGKELDLKITWSEEAGWGNYIEGLKSGRYDAYCSEAWPTPARLKNSLMLGPVTYQILNAYVRKEDNRFDGNLERINQADVTIPAIDGDVSVTMAKNRFPKAKLDTLPQMATLSDMFMSIISEKSDVFFLDASFYDALTKERPDSLKVVPNTPPVFIYGSYYSVRTGEDKLGKLIEIALQRIIDDGRLKKMADEYSDSYLMPAKGFIEK